MHTQRRLVALAVLALTCASASCATDVTAVNGSTWVVDWNRIARHMSPTAAWIVPHSRLFALIHIGMHDAAQSVLGRYETWAPALALAGEIPAAERGLCAAAAAVQAAHDVASGLVSQTSRPPVTGDDPSQPFGQDALQKLIDDQYSQHMALLPPGRSKALGSELGKRVAAQLLQLRASDHALPPGKLAPSSFDASAPKTEAFMESWWTPYIDQGALPPRGVWRQVPADAAPSCTAARYPAPHPSFAWWDTVTPFGLRSLDRFVAPPPAPPHQLDTSFDPNPDCQNEPRSSFMCQMEQTRQLGSADSTLRTPDQAIAARWWGNCNDAYAFSLFAAELVQRRQPDLSEAARTFALVSIAVADAFIVQKANKNRWNYWRPISAIRELSQPDWCPLLSTPPDQEYPAGHPLVTSAALATLAALFDDTQLDPPISFASQDTAAACTGGDATPPTRTFRSLDAALEEVVMARVWGGMHYESSGRASAELGRAVAREVVGQRLRALQSRR